MKFITVDSYDELSRIACDIIATQVKEKPNCVLGLATGSSPLGTYKNLADMCAKGELDFSKATSVNLDEYVGLDGSNDQSYRYFMNDKLFNHINIDMSNTHLPNGKAADLPAEAARYEKEVAALGYADLQVLGVGHNGHIGFNEPGTPIDSITHEVNLTENTIKDNSRLFASIDEVPKTALSMGIKNIMQAKSIIIIASGKNKAEAIKGMVDGKIDTALPASVLQLHPFVTVVVDKDAGSLL